MVRHMSLSKTLRIMEYVFIFSQFFLELHYYAQHLNTDRFNNQEQAFEQVEALRKIDPEFAKLEGTAFNSVTTVFESLCERMIDVLIVNFINSVQSMCNGYKREK